jgi:sensor histidine kinase YesM
VIADELRIEQVLVNIISNAIKYTPPGKTVALIVEEEPVEGKRYRYRFIVRDTGIGMTQEQIDKVLSREKNEGTEEFNESFGLWGTIERIRCYCDKDDVVRIRSEIGEYTEIEFILGLQPKRWKPTAD